MELEKKQLLFDLSEMSGYPILLDTIEDMVRLIETAVIRYDLNAGGVDGLLRAKCEAQGARKLQHMLQSHIKQLRLAALKA